MGEIIEFPSGSSEQSPLVIVEGPDEWLTQRAAAEDLTVPRYVAQALGLRQLVAELEARGGRLVAMEPDGSADALSFKK
jgi:high-affinity K+ transport system ATPase subunit B